MISQEATKGIQLSSDEVTLALTVSMETNR